MRLGVIADVHGNLPALEAVAARLRDLSVDRVVNLGDCASGPLWPAEATALLQASGFDHVRGNHDRELGSPDGAGLGQSDAFAWREMDAASRRWVSTLPFSLTIGEALCFHANLEDDLAYLMERVVDGRLLPAAEEAAHPALSGTGARLVLCGHSHQHRLLRLSTGTVVVNPGSVGCPAYHDPTMPAHVSESGSPHARFAVVTIGDGIAAEHHALVYDWAAAARRARANGRPDWEKALLTGLAR